MKVKHYNFIDRILTASDVVDVLVHANNEGMIERYAVAKAAIDAWQQEFNRVFPLRDDDWQQHNAFVKSVNSLCGEVTEYCEYYDIDCKDFIVNIRSWG